MPNTVRIKRRANGGGAGAPASLANAELAFNEQTNVLYYGTGTGGSGGSATSVIAIGGDGLFATKAYTDAAVAAVDVSSQLANYAALAGASFTGNVVVGGNLTVNGTQTIINSTTLTVDDKNVVLGDIATPTDTTADGGGITLKGATDKTLNWVQAVGAWTSSENFDLATGKTYRINGTIVLSSTALGSGVTGSSLTSVGTIASGIWQGTAIAVANGGTGATSAPVARTNLGLAIGTDVQAYNAGLAAIAGLTSAADRLPYFTGLGTAALATFTSFGRSLVDDADAATARTTLGLGSIATQAASNVSITGGSIDNISIDGGTF